MSYDEDKLNLMLELAEMSLDSARKKIKRQAADQYLRGYNAGRLSALEGVVEWMKSAALTAETPLPIPEGGLGAKVRDGGRSYGYGSGSGDCMAATDGGSRL